MKKFLSLVLALVMTMSLVTVSAGAKDFDDASDITYVEAVDVMSELKIVDGDTAGNFNPTNGLTRGAAAKIICNLILGPTTAAELNADTDPYPDVAQDSTFAGYIAYCQKEGIISGYADGTFKPANPLTGYAFMKMLLGALGYDPAVEGYTGANWSINVAKQAIGIGLNAGLVDNFNGSDYVTREEAMLYAFNTLQATMVDYDTTITIGDITVAGSNEYDVANNAKTEGIKDDNKMQFAEKYFTKLSVKDDVDAFERPANTWVNGKETIGTYVDYTTIVAEYTEGVAGNEVYDVIGKTAMEYDFAAYNDGYNAGSYITLGITKNNKADVVGTGNGVLTQVFVDNDKEEVVVTQINTYLAEATADYSAKKDTVSFTVYYPGGYEDDYMDIEVSGENFDIADVKEGDFVLVTVSFSGDEAAIETIDEVEVIEDTEIQKFSTGSSLTVDDTKYSYNEMAEYAFDVLDNYTDDEGHYTNLKDLTYNIYVDQYGYAIGVELVEVPDNYLFITGVDEGESNLANKTWTANAIFMDGTVEVIEIKNNGAINAEDFENFAIINKWFSYTVSNSDVYTLALVEDENAIINVEDADSVAQNQSTSSAVGEINAKHISLTGIGDDVRVYGNDATIYMLAGLDYIAGDVDSVVISDVDEVVTGVKNAAFTVYGKSLAAGSVDVDEDRENTNANTSFGVYALYKDNGYVIAAVVVGESDTVSSDLAYMLNTDASSESYDKTTKTWTWTRDAVIDGVEVELKEVNDTGVSVLDDADWGYEWVTVKYDANGNVKDIDYAEDVVESVAAAVELITEDEELVILENEGEDNQYTLKGNTLYDLTEDELGFLIAEDVKVVLEQEVKNVTEVTYDDGVKALENILKNLNEDEHDYDFAAVIEDGIATVVIVIDNGEDGAYDGPEAGGSNVDAITVTIGMTTVTYEIAEGAEDEVDGTDLADAIEAKMNKAGYSKIVVNLAEETVTAEKDGQSVILGIAAAE